MASLSSIAKETPEERINRISPEPKGIIEGYQQVFNGVDDYMKKVYQSIGIDLSTLLEKCAEIADQYNEPEVFETNPYTFTPPQTLIEFYIAKYIFVNYCIILTILSSTKTFSYKICYKIFFTKYFITYLF